MYMLFLSQKQLSRLAIVLFLALVAGVGLYGVLKGEETVTTMQVAPIYRGQQQFQAVALTFNVDWGEEYLPGILDILSRNQIKATFFLTGRWANKHPELTRRIFHEGHEIGNHGYSHPHANKLGKGANQEEINRTERVILTLTGHQTRLYAPPYGENSPHVVNAAWELGYRTIMWTIDTVDWQPKTSAEDIKRRVLEKVQNGAIVLMHPKEATVLALPEIIKEMGQKGYEFMTVSEIVAGID